MSNQISENFASSYFAFFSDITLGQYPYKVVYKTVSNIGNQIFTLDNLIPGSYTMIIYAVGGSGSNFAVSNFTQSFEVLANAASTLNTALYNVAQWNIPNSNSAGPISLVAITGGVYILLSGSSSDITNWKISIELISSN